MPDKLEEILSSVPVEEVEAWLERRRGGGSSQGMVFHTSANIIINVSSGEITVPKGKGRQVGPVSPDPIQVAREALLALVEHAYQFDEKIEHYRDHEGQPAMNWRYVIRIEGATLERLCAALGIRNKNTETLMDALNRFVERSNAD